MSALLSISNTVLVCPRLFGVAGNPNTCGAPAQLALLNAIIQQAKADYGCKTVILSGLSGGAGLANTFLGAYPGVVQATITWVGYFDLAEWYAFSAANNLGYDTLMSQTFGGGPTGALAAQYRAQSPSGTIAAARNCVVYINDGRLDTQIPPAQRTEMRDAFLALPSSAGITVNYIPYPEMGHAIDWPTHIAQINSAIAATA
jgi:dienelactone hydrolase